MAHAGGDARYQVLFEQMLDGFALHEMIFDGDGQPVDYRFLAVNPAFERTTGLRAQDIVGKTALEVLPGVERQWIENYGRVVATGEPLRFESRRAFRDKDFEVMAYRPQEGQFACIFRDVTSQKQNEREIRRQVYLNQLLSQVNQAIVKAATREELFESICRVVTGYGHFRLTWIGMVDEATGELRLHAQDADEKGFRHPVRAGECTVSRQCIHEGQPQICNRLCASQSEADCHLVAMESGIRSCAAFPIRLQGGVCGSLCVHAQEEDAFQEAEVKLLEDVAQDISFALDKLEADHTQSELEDRFTTAFEHFPAAACISTLEDGTFLQVNRQFEDIFGYSREELIGASSTGIGMLTVEFRGQLLACFEREGRLAGVEYQCRAKDGRIIECHSTLEKIRVGGRDRLLTVLQDITAEKRTERLLRETAANLSALLESTNDLIWSVDLDYRLIAFNSAFAEHVERFRGTRAAPGMTPDELVERDRADFWGAQYQRALAEGPFQLERALDDGRTLEFSLNVVVQDGKATGYSVFGKDISERKRSEAVSRRYELLSQRSRDIFLFVRFEDGGILEANRAAVDAYGYSADELLALSIQDLQPDSEWPLTAGRMADADTGGLLFEAVHRRKDGTTFPVEISLRGAAVEDSRVLISVVRDITERKRAEDDLKKSEEQLAKLFFCTPAAVVVSDLNEDRILKVNEAFVQISGYQPEEAIGRTTEELGLWVSQEEFHYAVGKLQAEGVVRDFECRFRRKTGEIRTCLISAGMIALSGETLVISVTTDITGRKRAEEAIREAEKKYREIFEGAIDGLYRTSPDGKLLAANPALARMLAYDSAEEVVSSCTDLARQVWFDPNERLYFSSLLEEQGEVRSYECRMKRKDGAAIWVSVSGRRAAGPDGETLYYEGFVEDVTERRQAQEELRISQQRLAQHVQHTPLAAIEFSLDGRITQWNPSATEIFGYSSREAIGQHWSFLVPAGSRNAVDAIWEGVAAQRAGNRSQNENVTKDGRTIHCEWFNTPILDPGGRTIAVASLVMDTTEQRLAEERLQQTNLRLQLAVASGGFGIWEWDVASNTVVWDDRIFEIYGVARSGFSGGFDAWQAGIHPDDRAAAVERVAAALSNESAYELEFRIVRPDGGVRYIRASGLVVRDAAGAAVRLIGLNRDITEHHLAEKALRESEARFRAVAESALVGIYILQDGKYAYVNPAMAAIFGYSAGEMAGMIPHDIVPPSDHATVDENIRRRIAGEVSTVQYEVRGRHRDGSLRDLEVHGTRVDINGVPTLVGTLVDNTERKRAEHESARLQLELLQVQKMESIGRLAGGVAHDFNNLLTVINGYALLLMRSVTEGDALAASIREIHNAGEKAARLTRQLLAFSRKQVVDPKQVDLNALIAENMDLLRRLVGEDVTVVTELGRDLGAVMADPGQLNQVLMNLVVNARDAMPSGGTLTLRTLRLSLDEETAPLFPDASPGCYAAIEVADTGEGMSAEVQEKIFEPFFTTKVEGAGTGLGLSTVYGIVRQAGGWVAVESQPGMGATFRIGLPMLHSDFAAVAEAPPPSELTGTETILVVEDQDEVRKIALAILEGFHYRTLSAASGAEALRIAADYPGPIHLVLTDVVMPGMNGRQLAEGLVALHPETKVLYMSGYTADVTLRHGVAEPRAHFIQKPFEPEALASKVRAILGGARAMKNILVVDDEESVRGLFVAVLTDAGFDVAEAGDGGEAAKMIRTRPFDLVLTDLMMPNPEGGEIIQVLRKSRPDLKIIAVSGAFGGNLQATAALLGADATLAKPVSPDRLLEAVRNTLGL